MKDELEAIVRSTGKVPKQLNYPKLPPQFMPVVGYSSELSETSNIEIKAFADLMGINLDPIEVKLIKDIGYVRKAVLNGRRTDEILRDFNYG